MQVDFLIIGQGISGTWLSWYLQKEGKSFIVIDDNAPNTPSRLAAGIINPVTGRRHVEVWMAETLLPFSLNAYSELGSELGISAISEKTIIDFFPTAQMRLSFQQRVEEKAAYVSLAGTKGDLRDLFNYEFGYGEINPVYTAHLETILPEWRKKLEAKGQLREERFDLAELDISTSVVRYKDIIAKKMIYCDGNSSNTNPLFKNLPFAPNKGEALIIEIAGLPADTIYKKGLTLTPLAEKDRWWVGSSYEWEFEHTDPTDEFRTRTEGLLKSWLKIPWKILDHLAGVRPATLERRPFVGLHPHQPLAGILNGMGAKGCLLAPFFGRQLVDHLLHNSPISPEADIKRFSKILARQGN